MDAVENKQIVRNNRIKVIGIGVVWMLGLLPLMKLRSILNRMQYSTKLGTQIFIAGYVIVFLGLGYTYWLGSKKRELEIIQKRINVALNIAIILTGLAVGVFALMLRFRPNLMLN